MRGGFPDRTRYHVYTCALGHIAESGDVNHHPKGPRFCWCGRERTFECPPGCKAKEQADGATK